MCLAQAASTFFHSASSGLRLGLAGQHGQRLRGIEERLLGRLGHHDVALVVDPLRLALRVGVMPALEQALAHARDRVVAFRPDLAHGGGDVLDGGARRAAIVRLEGLPRPRQLALGVAVGRGQDRVHELHLGLVRAKDRVRKGVVGGHHLGRRGGRGRLRARPCRHQHRQRARGPTNAVHRIARRFIHDLLGLLEPARTVHRGTPAQAPRVDDRRASR